MEQEDLVMNRRSLRGYPVVRSLPNILPWARLATNRII